MRSCRSGWVGLAAALVVMACVGCPRGDDSELPGGTGDVDQVTSPSDHDSRSSERRPKPEPEPPPPAEVPEVHLTEADLATCLVGVDDVMPDDTLVDLDGNPQRLGDLFGEKLTVVFFWAAGDSLYSKMAATAALEDLAKDIAEPFSEKGVRVVGVNVRDEPQLAGEHVSQAEATFVNLVDPEGAFFSRVATEKLPRLYLLDAAGKILWFDFQYSRTTRRDLLQAIQVELGEI